MSKIKDALVIDVPVNDTDYDYYKSTTEQLIDDAKDFEEESWLNKQEDMVGVTEEEKMVGDTLSYSPEE
jgi:hypothetical protein